MRKTSVVVDAAWVALSLAEHVGGKKLHALVAEFGDARAVLQADVSALRKVPGIGPKISQIIHNIDLADIEAAIPRWQDAGVSLLRDDDNAYPARPRELADSPPTLFVRGVLPPQTERTVAIVGTRQPTPEAVEVAQRLAAQLVQRGCVIVSGLARGIDREAHMAALSASGRTIAVLGSGVLNIYPPEHQSLADAIVLQGALVSELNPDASPSATYLVARNRLISGLSDAVIVVETSIDGGAMHAARWARQQGRALYAVMSSASGNQALIDEMGAKPLNPETAYFKL